MRFKGMATWAHFYVLVSPLLKRPEVRMLRRLGIFTACHFFQPRQTTCLSNNSVADANAVRLVDESNENDQRGSQYRRVLLPGQNFNN